MTKKILYSTVFILFVVIALSAFNLSSIALSATEQTRANWWDSMFGIPKYGGTMNIGASDISTGSFDPYNWMNVGQVHIYDPLWIIDPTLDRTKVDLTCDWVINTNYKGHIAQSWEWPDPQTMVVQLRQDVYWQNKAPVNGRQFTADDVIFHFDRLLGTGNGFTTPNPFFAGRLGSLQTVTAPDKFTVVFKFGTPGIFANSEIIITAPSLHFFEAPEVYAMGQPIEPAAGPQKGPSKGPKKGGGGTLNSALNDWHNAVGTGPFVLSDFVSGSIISFSNNSSYWGYDERYPRNRLPYVDTLNIIDIQDPSTKLAAFRTEKIDIIDNITWKQEAKIKETNPDLLSGRVPQPGLAIDLRCDSKPFSDINVRKALQLALDLPAIARGYYGGTVSPDPVGLVSPAYSGFAIPYKQWPAELQQEYSYNPTKAKQLLSDAGYPDGFSVNCMATAPFSDLQLLQALQSYFKDINVNVNIETLDIPTFMSLVTARKHKPMVAWSVASVMPPLSGMQMYVSSEATNPLMHNDSKFDQMVKACNSAASVADAQKQVNDVGMYFLQQHWVVLTPPNYTYIFWHPYFKGYAGEKNTIDSHYSLRSPYLARIWINKGNNK